MAATLSAARFELAQPKFRKKIRTFCSKNYRRLPGLERQDLEGEMLEVLWLACMKYDPDQGAGFNTFFWTCAQRRLMDLHKAANRQMRSGDFHWVWLESESIADFINELLEASAEEMTFAKIDVAEIYRSRVLSEA
jgi:DNA-directed RNA polymerase specialized sigma24 family protein